MERLERFAEQVWLLITDPKIPFDNNQAERDIRMLKVIPKVKIFSELLTLQPTPIESIPHPFRSK